MWKNLPLITGSSLDGTEIPASPKKKPCESWKLNKRLNMPYTITEKCNGCGACARICPSGAISGEKKKLHAIDGALCIDCGACGRICPQSALLDAGGSECLMIKRSEWLKPDFILETCMACSICVDACPRVVWPCRICRGKGCGCLALFKVSQGLYRLRSVFPGMPVGYHCDEESAKKHNR